MGGKKTSEFSAHLSSPPFRSNTTSTKSYLSLPHSEKQRISMVRKENFSTTEMLCCTNLRITRPGSATWAEYHGKCFQSQQRQPCSENGTSMIWGVLVRPGTNKNQGEDDQQTQKLYSFRWCTIRKSYSLNNGSKLLDIFFSSLSSVPIGKTK